MDGTTVARLGAIIFVAIAVTAAAIEMTRKDDAPAPSSVRVFQPRRDSLREGQLRCQEIGPKAADDAECLRVWAESRARFLGRAPASSSSSEGR